MPRYYVVTWVDAKGETHKTLTASPERLHSKVQAKRGPTSGVIQVDYSDARGIEGTKSYKGPVYKYEPPPEKKQPTAIVTVPFGAEAHTLPGGETTISYPPPPTTSPVKTIPLVKKDVGPLSLVGSTTKLISQIVREDPLKALGVYYSYVFNPYAAERVKTSLVSPPFETATEKTINYGNIVQRNLQSSIRYNIQRQSDIERAGYEYYQSAWETGDVLKGAAGVISSPLGITAVSYGLGTGLGAFGMTKIGQYPVAQIFGKTITPSAALNIATATYFSSETIRSGAEAYRQKQMSNWLFGTGITLPFVLTPFKRGYEFGAGYVQRTGAMSKVTSSLERVQQSAIHDMLKINERLLEPVLPSSYNPYNIRKVQTMTPRLAGDIETFLSSFKGRYIYKGTVGGSTAMRIRMGELYRGGYYPERILNIARARQLISGKPKPLRLSGEPIDVDILLRGFFATEKAASRMSSELGTHVHLGKTGQYYWGGYTTKPSVKGYIAFSEVIETKTIGIREQFMRTLVSSLPSETPRTGYRSFKDIPGMYKAYEQLQYQKGGSELQTTMYKYMYPELHKPPKITFGEKFIKKIGGVVEPIYTEIMGGQFIEPIYPKSVYPSRYPSYMLGGGLIRPYYKSVSDFGMYYPKTISTESYKPSQISYKYISPYQPIIEYKPVYPPSPTIYKPPSPTYKPPVYPPSKTPYTPIIPTYKTPPYKSPPYKPPVYFPPYKPPKYETDLIDTKFVKTFKLPKKWLTGYRERKHKVPTLEDLIGW